MQGPTFDHQKHLLKILIQLNSFRNDFPLALATAANLDDYKLKGSAESECQHGG